MTRRRQERGLTLIEVLLAVAIIGIMGSLVWGSFGRLLQVTNDLQDQSQFWHGVRVALHRVARETSAAFVSDNFDPNRYRSDDPEGRPTFFLIEDGGNRDRLVFTAFVHRRLYEDEKASDQAVVEYFVDRDDEGRTHLYRRYKALIDEDWDRDGETNLLLQDVEEFQVEWWDPDDEDWERDWDTRDQEQHDRLPSRVRISITAVDPEGVSHSFQTQARLLLTSPLSW